jgi:hypothetical protein
MSARAAALAALLAVALSGGASAQDGAAPGQGGGSASASSSAPLALVLEPYLWRNFQPGTTATDTRLMAVFRVRTADGRPLPASVRLDSAWVVRGRERWAIALAEPDERWEPHAIEATGRGGPPWEIGSRVTVVVRLRDASGRVWRLEARDQRIRRTD